MNVDGSQLIAFLSGVVMSGFGYQVMYSSRLTRIETKVDELVRWKHRSEQEASHERG